MSVNNLLSVEVLGSLVVTSLNDISFEQVMKNPDLPYYSNTGCFQASWHKSLSYNGQKPYKSEFQCVHIYFMGLTLPHTLIPSILMRFDYKTIGNGEWSIQVFVQGHQGYIRDITTETEKQGPKNKVAIAPSDKQERS